MNVWLVVGAVIVAIVVWLLMKMSASAKAINNYFCDASLVFGTTGDEAAKLAALAAAKTAAAEQRQSMVDYLTGLSADLKATNAAENAKFRKRWAELKNEIEQKDWSVEDSRHAKTLLSAVDPAATAALNKSSANYFRNLHKDVFE